MMEGLKIPIERVSGYEKLVEIDKNGLLEMYRCGICRNLADLTFEICLTCMVPVCIDCKVLDACNMCSDKLSSKDSVTWYTIKLGSLSISCPDCLLSFKYSNYRQHNCLKQCGRCSQRYQIAQESEHDCVESLKKVISEMKPLSYVELYIKPHGDDTYLKVIETWKKLKLEPYHHYVAQREL